MSRRSGARTEKENRDLPRLTPDRVIGLLAIVLGIVAILWWVPADAGSPLIERVRGRLRIGDAMAPTVALAILVLGGVVLLLETRLAKHSIRLSPRSLIFLVHCLIVIAVAFALMRWIGPIAVAGWAAATDSTATYRDLRDTVPWKYLGFLVGGTFLVATPIVLCERRFSLRAVLIGLFSAAAMMAVYDLPFDDLLLPPNGDV